MSNTGTTAYPATLDGFLGLGTARKEDESGYTHVAMHNQDQAAILALEVAVGTTQGTGVLKNFTAGNLAAKTANETFGTPTLQNAILGTPAITSGSANNITIGTSTIGTSDIIGGTAAGVITEPGIGTATDGATVTFNLATRQIWDVTLEGNRTLAVSNPAVGKFFIISLKQDGTGERTVTWFSTIKWSDDTVPTLGTAASNVDSYGFLCTATDTYRGYVVGEGIDES